MADLPAAAPAVRMLLRGPAGSADLIATVQAELSDEGYPPAAAAALKHDLDALKAEYGDHHKSGAGYLQIIAEPSSSRQSDNLEQKA